MPRPRCRSGPAVVSPPTIRQRILKGTVTPRNWAARSGFTPHDPTEDTESTIQKCRGHPCWHCFTPHDPTEDTESIIGKRLDLIRWSFTPHDPTEDTESQIYLAVLELGREVSPPTIRQRILKGNRINLIVILASGFTPHDPTEDTESYRYITGKYADIIRFTPHDPTEDTERFNNGNDRPLTGRVSPPTIRQRILKERCLRWASLSGTGFHPPRSDRGY